MENKKNYVDGVDVSECEHYRAEIETKMPYGEYETLKDKCYYSGIEVIQDCKGNKGCIYKQLKRLQAENEQLKKSIDRIMQNKEIKTIDLDIAKENVELKAENERLKEEQERQCDYIVNYKNYKYEQEQKYSQALQEIRVLIKKLDLSLGCAYGDYDCDNCSDINEETVCKIKLQNIILAKINEVIGAEE